MRGSKMDWLVTGTRETWWKHRASRHDNGGGWNKGREKGIWGTLGSRRLVRSSPRWFRAGNKRGKGENGQSQRGGEDSYPSSDRPERKRKSEVSRREIIELVEEWGLHFCNWSSRPEILRDEFWTKNVLCKRMGRISSKTKSPPTTPPQPLIPLRSPDT